ncbi:MAG: arginyltransferase [Helicobacteraceae bacterium]|jgi:arginine-tRNA-protein transferase|nr:arginyltransferase [Helicobacteraceae bacterium]
MKSTTTSIFISSAKPCPYLAGVKSNILYHVGGVNRGGYAGMLERGYRRFGRLFFRPACETCNECKSLRVKTAEFNWTRSFRRVAKINADIKTVVRRPTVSDERLAMFERFHQNRTDIRGWEYEPNGEQTYYEAFVDYAKDFGYELTYYLNDRLIGVALTDVLPEGHSAVYCYYDPDFSSRSIGTFSILKQIEIAASCNVPYLYLGYVVAMNRSLNYKVRFKPYEILRGAPGSDEPAFWETG